MMSRGGPQADILRRRVREKNAPTLSGQRPHTLVVRGGKGGVGKSNVSLNLAWKLAQNGKRVLLMDTDFGLSNLDVLLGISPPYDMGDVLESRCSPEEALMPLAPGLSLLLGGDLAGDDSPDVGAIRDLLCALSTQMAKRDYVIIDTRAGLSETVMAFLSAADTGLMVTNTEPTAILDTYRTMKRLQRYDPPETIGVVINRAERAEADRAYRSLARMIRRFLGRNVSYLTWIPEDHRVREAVLRQCPLLEIHPRSRAALGIDRLARALTGQSSHRQRERGGFLNRLAKNLLGIGAATGGDDL